jgi:hypothetical protein
MASKEGMSQNEIELQKTLFVVSEMVKVLYEDYLQRKRPFQGKRSSLARIERKKNTLMTIAGNFIPRRDQNGSKKGKGGK